MTCGIPVPSSRLILCATLAELMNRLGHSTPAMAICYQHASEDRDMLIARRLSEMVEGH